MMKSTSHLRSLLTNSSRYPMKADIAEYYFVPELPLYAWTRTNCWNEGHVQFEHKHGQAPDEIINVCPAATVFSITHKSEIVPHSYKRPLHPIVSVHLDCVNPAFQSDISASHIPWVVDHCLQGNIVIPGVPLC